MEHSSIMKIIIINAVKKGIRDIKNNSSRGLRYLVDLGAHFSKSRVQKEFFHTAQSLLNNPKSAYYSLTKEVVKKVDQKTLETFGINIGYMSWTYGANIIRQHENDHGYNVPWTIFLDCTFNAAQSIDLGRLIAQGQAMGIYTYMVFAGEQAVSLVELFRIFASYPDCAFILFSNSDSLSSLLGKESLSLNNVMISVGHSQNNRERNMSLLAEKKRLFGVHFIYNDENVSEIISGRLLKQYHSLAYPFAFFVASDDCSPETVQSVCDYVKSCRKGQQYPILIFDLYTDVDYADQVISTESCMAKIRYDGTVIAGNEIVSSINALTSSLEQILSHTMPRTVYTKV